MQQDRLVRAAGSTAELYAVFDEKLMVVKGDFPMLIIMRILNVGLVLQRRSLYDFPHFGNSN